MLKVLRLLLKAEEKKMSSSWNFFVFPVKFSKVISNTYKWLEDISLKRMMSYGLSCVCERISESRKATAIQKNALS